MTTYDPDSREERLLPNAVELAALVNNNIVYNFLRDGSSRTDLPSDWRLAKCVVTEAAPLLVYTVPLR